MMTIRCPHCGTTNRAGSNFCNHCGAELRPDQGADPPFAEAPSAPVPRSEVDEPLSDFASDTDGSLEAFTDSQPWLRPEADSSEEPVPPEEERLSGTKRLVVHVQGLLEPLRVLSDASEEELLAATPLPLSSTPPLSAEQVRRLRSLMSEEPVLVEAGAPPLPQHWPSLRISWLFLFFGLLVGLPVLLLVPDPPPGDVHVWPGVAEAYAAIQAIRPGDSVLIWWAYDPATSGEMDQVTLPLVVDLLERQAQPVVVSQLPNGPATARRLFLRALAATEIDVEPGLAVASAQFSTGGFLPGGAGGLPLLGVNLAEGLYSPPGENALALARATAQRPVLAVVVAAHAEDVQEWLEQVQPLNGAPVVAFTSAGVDPLVRPYLATGQLTGLVSGFDGAQAYHDLQQEDGVSFSASEENMLRRLRIFQNWGHIAFLVTIALGNLAALLGKGGR